MVDVMRLYLDDSGTRHPDRKPGQTPHHGHDWFGLGGILVRERDVETVKARHAALITKWPLAGALHSYEIRGRVESFRWLQTCDANTRDEFLRDITTLVTSEELVAIACVVDRPGYNHRYREKYGTARWSLCKTAFHIVVERSAKFARRHGCVLRVYVERSDKKTDRNLNQYYNELRASGHPFGLDSAAQYEPLAPIELAATLYEFRTKAKTSRLMQIADLVLWPMCIGGYEPDNRAYGALRAAGTLIDCKIPPEEIAERGIKYSCWDLEQRQLRKDQSPT